MREPNFFIAGGPKCGTTALFNYLHGHPHVFVPWAKEPHYFAEDLPGRREFKRYEDYLELFAPSQPQHRAIGEGSVLYLYSRCAIMSILQRRPNAKIIVMLRNPCEMVPAMHAEWLYGLYEDVPDLPTAWRLQPERAQGRAVPHFCREPKMLQYRAIASQGSQLLRLLTLTAPEQRLVIVYDDFAAHTAAVYTRTLEFLGLPHDGRTEFPRINPRKQLRWPWLQQLMCHRRLPESIRLIGRRTGLHKVHRWLWKKNAMPAQRALLSREFAAEMRSALRDEVGLTSELLGRDLSHWLAC